MATNLKMADRGVNTEADSLAAQLNGGKLQIWDGAQPATADTTSGAAVLGVTLTLNATAFGAATAGVITANAIAAVTAIASITAAWCRFQTASSVNVMDGSVGTSAANVVLNSVAISAGALVTISSVVHTVSK